MDHHNSTMDALGKKIDKKINVCYALDDVHCYASLIKGDDGNDHFHIHATIHNVTIVDKKIHMLNTSADALLKYVDELVNYVKLAYKKIGDVFNTVQKSADSIELTASQDYTPPVSVSTGQCAYKSLGNIRYAFVRFDSPSFRVSWTKVFFTKDAILFDKTTQHMETWVDAKTAPKHYNDTPPLVLPVKRVHIPLVTRAIKDESGWLLRKLNGLPLNTSGIREDASWGAIYVGKMSKKGVFTTCYANVLADPRVAFALITRSARYNLTMAMVDDELWSGHITTEWDRHEIVERCIIEEKIGCEYASSIMDTLLAEFFGR